MLPVVVLLAAGFFFVPQRPALSWWAPAFPRTERHYLELACAARGPDELVLQPEIFGRFDPSDAIVLPLSPSEHAYSFSFPLPDAPLTALRLTARPGAAPLEIRSLRIVTGDGREVLRLRRASFSPVADEEIAATENGWTIRAGHRVPGQASVFTRFSGPVLAPGANHRNAVRCASSVAFLAGVLAVLLLAGTLAVRPRLGKRLCLTLGSLALLAAIVSHRGLLLASLRTWHSPKPPPARALRLELDARTARASPAQLFWNTGRGISEEQSARAAYRDTPHLETLTFPLPAETAVGLRFDPLDHAGSVVVQSLRLVDDTGRTRALIPLETLRAVQQIDRLARGPDGLEIRTTPDATDPILDFDAAGVSLVNATVRAAGLGVPAGR